MIRSGFRQLIYEESRAGIAFVTFRMLDVSVLYVQEVNAWGRRVGQSEQGVRVNGRIECGEKVIFADQMDISNTWLGSGRWPLECSLLEGSDKDFGGSSG